MARNHLFVVLVLGLFCVTHSSAQEISVFSGFLGTEYYQDDKKITRKEAKALLLGHENSAEFWKKKATNEALFGVTNLISLGGAVWLGVELGRDNRDNRDLLAPSLVTLGGTLISAIFFEGANKNSKKAILTYNKQFDDNQTSFKVAPVLDGDGLGMALRF